MRKLRHCPRSQGFIGDQMMTGYLKGMSFKNAAETTVEIRIPQSHYTKTDLVDGKFFLSNLLFVLISATVSSAPTSLN